MRTTAPAIRAIALGAGFSFCLTTAALLAQDPASEAAGPVVGNKLTKTYHRPSCATLKKAQAKNQEKFENPAAAELQAYKPCPICKPNPDAAKPSSTKTKSKASKGSALENDNSIKFSRDIAPVFVGNCVGCHGPEQQKKKFDLSTFNKLMAGGESGKVITPKNPDDSLLVLHIKGENGLRKMPPGNQRNLAPETISKIEKWVKDGALLDAGIDPAALLSKIAPSTDEIRKSVIAKMSPEQRDKKLEEVALERWRKGSSKTTPEVTSGKNFLIFGTLPTKRAEALAKALEAQRNMLGSLLGTAANVALGGPEKISVYVFNDLSAYAEFLRGVENREPEAGVEANGNLKVEAPYIACVDPLNGQDEPATSAKKSGKSKKTDDADSPTRSLLGLVTEQLGVAATSAAGKAPRYLSTGVGAFLASQVDGRSSYFRQLRVEAFRTYEAGWTTKASEVLGGEGGPERIKAVGFSLIDWLYRADRHRLQGFVDGMLGGQEKLDDTIRAGWGATREQFLQTWGGWVAASYRRR
jgi:hypothetical protein